MKLLFSRQNVGRHKLQFNGRHGVEVEHRFSRNVERRREVEFGRSEDQTSRNVEQGVRLPLGMHRSKCWTWKRLEVPLPLLQEWGRYVTSVCAHVITLIC